MRSFALGAFLMGTALAAAGCGGGVHVPMGQVPNTPQTGDIIGGNAVRLGCQGRPRRGRYQLRCPGVVHPERRVYMVIFDDARVECVAEEGFEDDCRAVFDQLLAGAPTAGGYSAVAPGSPLPPGTAPGPGAPVHVLWNNTWYPAVVLGSPVPGTVVVHYDGYASTSDETVTLDRVRLR